jgi:hypothetical protein
MIIPLRRLNNKELADLPSNWENATVDTTKYYETCIYVWETTEADYRNKKSLGWKCQIFQGKYYIGV